MPNIDMGAFASSACAGQGAEKEHTHIGCVLVPNDVCKMVMNRKTHPLPTDFCGQVVSIDIKGEKERDKFSCQLHLSTKQLSSSHKLAHIRPKC